MSNRKYRRSTRSIPESVSYVLGALIQGLVLGALLLVAIQQILSSTVGQIFRYQGF